MRYAMAHTQNEWRIYIDVTTNAKKRKNHYMFASTTKEILK